MEDGNPSGSPAQRPPFYLNQNQLQMLNLLEQLVQQGQTLTPDQQQMLSQLRHQLRYELLGCFWLRYRIW